MRGYKLFYLTLCFVAFVVAPCYAEDINIIYTGQTHAMLYPCGCPVEDDGGVTRRASLIKELRRKNPNTLLLDSGDFFAGGLLDQYTQNTQLDMQRTKINLQAMELMHYDAVAVGDNEFNFGVDFFKQNTQNSNLNFLSANIECGKVLPFVIKQIKGIKIGIISLTNPVAKYKGSGLKFIDPKEAILKTMPEFKKNNPDIVIVLSNLEEKENLNLINEVGGIDILITGIRSKEEPYSKTGPTLVINPSWQGRKLGVLSLRLENKKIKKYKVELMRLSDKIKDDPQVKAILPRCFSDRDCKEGNLIGTCLNPGGLNANCKFQEQKKIGFFIILPKDCVICETKPVVDYLKKYIPGLTPGYLYYPDAKAMQLIKELKISGLPAYVFKKEIQGEKGFLSLRPNLEEGGKFYLLKPEVGGLSYILNRKIENDKIDLLISLYNDNSHAALEAIREYDPQVHFLAMEQENKFTAMKGEPEVEEYLRCMCVEKYYPEKFWDYIICRAKNINSSWWDNCLPQEGAYAKIKSCATSEEAKLLLRENIRLNHELKISFGPAYLLNNHQIFTTQGPPRKEDLKKVFDKIKKEVKK